uniref:Neprilysin n=1 Tax=Dracunculus medinensis TaxID=318479 RepID=A0A158Q2M1_DRAME
LYGFSRLEVCLIFASLTLLCFLIGVCVLWLLILDGYRQIIDGSLFSSRFSSLRTIEKPFAFDKMAIHHSGIVCTTRECALIAGFLAENLNDKVNPCDDFYEYACGNYPLNRHLPSNKASRHTLSDMQTRLYKQIKQILEVSLNDEEPWDRLAKQYYEKCMEEDIPKWKGIQALRGLLKLTGGWPVLEGRNWKSWPHNWTKQLAIMFNKTGMNAVIMELAVTQDPKNSSRNVIELDQPKWGIGSRWPYLTGFHDQTIQNYLSLMIDTATNLGADRKIAENDMKEAIEFELRLVDFSSDEMIRRDPERSNNPYQLWQLSNAFPFIDLEGYIREIFDGIVEISPNDTVIIREIEYFRSIQRVMQSTNKRVIANYLQWRTVQGYSSFLPEQIREPFYAFKANLTGMPSSPALERWEDCIFLSLMIMDIPVGKLYIENFFNEKQAMNKMFELTTYFKNELVTQLNNVDWMDEITRRKAIIKAKHVQYKSGFPPYIFNKTWMNSIWGHIEVHSAESLIQLTIKIKLARIAEELSRFKKPVDRSIWFQSPAQVDAYYAPNLNEMIFPAGIMQFPFMTIGVPNYITYAMVGAVVGHEVSHAFDDQGGRYDELGNLHDWWETATAKKFHEKAECFIRQYDSIKVEEVGIHLNGRLSVGENIADNAGVKTALMAYKSWLKDNSASEASLPGFQNFSSEQMFFLAYANNWCSLIRPKHYVQLILADVHAPNKYRAIIPLRNSHEFASAYHCHLGSPMNPRKKCSIW